MKILNGSLDNIIFFIALDAATGLVRQTGLDTWTVWYQLNGGTAAAMTTPTIVELDNSTMQGVYSLIIDETLMTKLSDDKSEELVMHITHAGMLEVTRFLEVYAKPNDGKFNS